MRLAVGAAGSTNCGSTALPAAPAASHLRLAPQRLAAHAGSDRAHNYRTDMLAAPLPPYNARASSTRSATRTSRSSSSSSVSAAATVSRLHAVLLLVILIALLVL